MSVYWNLQLSGIGGATNTPKEALEGQNPLWSMSGHVISLIEVNQKSIRSPAMPG